MQYKLRLHRLLMEMLLAVLIAFVLLFLYLNSFAPDIWVEASVALVVEIIVSTGLVYMGVAEGIIAAQFGARHKRELLSYILLGLFSIGGGLYLAITEASSLMTVALVIAPHVFLFGIAELRVAHCMSRHSAQRRALQICGLSELCMGFGLIAVSRKSNPAAAMFLAYAATLTTLQLAGFLLYRSSFRAQKV